MVDLRAHPRSRGENAASSWGGRQFPGSSPLTRGILDHEPLVAAALRLIPAHTGETGRTTATKLPSGAHPRSCGENAMSPGQITAEEGSSSLTQGKHEDERYPGCAVGLIPAHAGKTHMVTVLVTCSRAHPHSRGENLRKSAHMSAGSGSFPLTRGKPARSDPSRPDPRVGSSPLMRGKRHPSRRRQRP